MTVCKRLDILWFEKYVSCTPVACFKAMKKIIRLVVWITQKNP